MWSAKNCLYTRNSSINQIEVKRPFYLASSQQTKHPITFCGKSGLEPNESPMCKVHFCLVIPQYFHFKFICEAHCIQFLYMHTQKPSSLKDERRLSVMRETYE